MPTIALHGALSGFSAVKYSLLAWSNAVSRQTCISPQRDILRTVQAAKPALPFPIIYRISAG